MTRFTIDHQGSEIYIHATGDLGHTVIVLPKADLPVLIDQLTKALPAIEMPAE